MSLIQQEIKADLDDHVFLVIRQEGKPVISIDLTNTHHRRSMFVRLDGMQILSFYADVESPEKASGERFARFCPFCGEEYNLVSSKIHRCDDH